MSILTSIISSSLAFLCPALVLFLSILTKHSICLSTLIATTMIHDPKLCSIAGVLSALLCLPPTTRAAPLVIRATSKADYIRNAMDATNVMNNKWYYGPNGTWADDWWNSANIVTNLAGLAQVDPDFMGTANGMFENILTAAPASNGGSFLNDFYDDEGWYGLSTLVYFRGCGNADWAQVGHGLD